MRIGRQFMVQVFHSGELHRDPTEMNILVPVGVTKPKVLIHRPDA